MVFGELGTEFHAFATSAPKGLRPRNASTSEYPDLQAFISNVLKQDPRPAYKKQKDGQQSYGMTLYNYNICWQVNESHNLVTSIENT